MDIDGTRAAMEKVVSCHNFVGLLAYIRSHYGAAGIEQVVRGLVDNEEYLIADKYDPGRTSPIQVEHLEDPAYWVSYEFCLALFSNVKKLIGGESPLFQAGEGAAMQSISRKALLISHIFGIKFLAKQVTKLNARFNRSKVVELADLTDHSALFILSYFPQYKVSKDICNWNRGVYTGISKATGATEVRCEELQCGADGYANCVFRLTWKEAGFLKRTLRGLLRFAMKDVVQEYESTLKDREELIDRLTHSEKRYHALFHYSPIQTVVVDEEGRIIEFNLAKQNSGTRVPNIGDRMYVDYAGKHGLSMVRELKEVIQSGVPKEFPEIQYGDRFLQVRMSPFPGGAIITSVDITDTKKARDALRESEERYRLLAENARDVIWTMDMNGNLTYVSPSVLNARGYTPEEVMGRRMEEQMTEDSLAAARRTLAEELALEHAGSADPDRSCTLELEYRKKDGSTYWSEVKLTFLRDADGKALGILGVGRDIAERKRAEEERKRLESHLRQAQKMEAIGTLAGGIAHRFNNALAVIVASLDLLEMDIPKEAGLARYLEPMKDAATRMGSLTSQLLAYARGGKYMARVIVLSDFVKDTLPLLEHTVRPPISVVTSLPSELWQVKADVTQMQMVLSALLANAADAVESDGQVRISCRNVSVSEEFATSHPGLTPGPYVLLTIQDTGKGMDEETRSRIFEPFYTTKFKGRGLGMAAVYGIVKNHGGWIRVESGVGRGTTVSIYLPAVATEREGRKEIPQALPKSTGTLLVVEDEKLVMDATCKLLEALGYAVIEAKTGGEAIDIARTHPGPIDLALLDIVLPDMEAKDVYHHLANCRPDLKVIVCSGYSIDGPAQQVMDAGAQAFLQKPFTMATLSKAVRETLGG